jgi:hypothetical protein
MTSQPSQRPVGRELEGGAVVADDLEGRRCVFLAALYRAEREIAEKLKTLAAGKPHWPSIDVDRAIPWVEQRTKLALADSQKAALQVALVSNVTVITGGPGVGKTTLVNSLLKILIAKAFVIALCAPTGRAAKRLSESTGLHRPLEFFDFIVAAAANFAPRPFRGRDLPNPASGPRVRIFFPPAASLSQR